MARAMSSLPVPLAPSTSTVLSLSAICGRRPKHLPHRRAAANDVGKGVLLLHPAVQFLDHPQVAKALDAADDPPAPVLQCRRRDADWNLPPPCINDVHHLVHNRTAGGEGVFERAGVLADARAEHVAAAAPQGGLATDAGDLFRGRG